MKKIVSLQRKRYVYKVNNKGFTLLETLFAFSLFTLIIFMISPALQKALDSKGQNTVLQYMQWNVFCSQIKQEIHSSQRMAVVKEGLVLTVDNQLVSYEKFGNSLRRRVNSEGNETLLQHVLSVTFKILNKGVLISVKDLNGKEYTARFYSFLDWNLDQ